MKAFIISTVEGYRYWWAGRVPNNTYTCVGSTARGNCPKFTLQSVHSKVAFHVHVIDFNPHKYFNHASNAYPEIVNSVPDHPLDHHELHCLLFNHSHTMWGLWVSLLLWQRVPKKTLEGTQGQLQALLYSLLRRGTWSTHESYPGHKTRRNTDVNHACLCWTTTSSANTLLPRMPFSKV